MRNVCLQLLWVAVALPLSAGSLPLLRESPWIGWFSAYECRKFRFGVDDKGVGVLQPFKERREDEVITWRHWIKIEPVIEEIQDGRVVTKRIDDDGWQALSKSSTEAEAIAYRGTVTDGATFEVRMELERNTLVVGGRLVDRGGLTQHPVRFSIRVIIPDVYCYVEDPEEVEERADRDRLRFERVDGERFSLDGWEKVKVGEIQGDGLEKVRLELEGYDDRRVELETLKGGRMFLWNGDKERLHEGFTIQWRPEGAAVEDGSGRFKLEFD
jgi:hypothetical protein